MGRGAGTCAHTTCVNNCNKTDNNIVVISHRPRSEVLSTKEANEEVKEISVIIRFQHAPCPTFCSRRECGKPGSDLKRCTRCRTVAYCNRLVACDES